MQTNRMHQLAGNALARVAPAPVPRPTGENVLVKIFSVLGQAVFMAYGLRLIGLLVQQANFDQIGESKAQGLARNAQLLLERFKLANPQKSRADDGVGPGLTDLVNGRHQVPLPQRATEVEVFGRVRGALRHRGKNSCEASVQVASQGDAPLGARQQPQWTPSLGMGAAPLGITTDLSSV